jgi:DNA-directed RNA polymerase specialized sigma24 family protein
MNGKSCGCIVCDLERALLEELSDPQNAITYLAFASESTTLSRFQSASELIQYLHRSEPVNDNTMADADQILGELIRLGEAHYQDMSQRLLLLALMPAVHKTSRVIALKFPTIAREDIGQHLLTGMLELLRSRSVRTRRSHFAFAIARSLRRYSFRWAIREAGFAPSEDEERLSEFQVGRKSDEALEINIELRSFLHRCLSDRLLTESEHESLILFKLHEIPAETLAAREGLSEGAFRHRMLRLIARLRRAAQSPALPTAKPATAATNKSQPGKTLAA